MEEIITYERIKNDETIKKHIFRLLIILYVNWDLLSIVFLMSNMLPRRQDIY